MKLLKVFYSSSIPLTAIHDSNGTNHFTQHVDDTYEGCNELIFELSDNSGVQKLSNVWNETVERDYHIEYNVYETVTSGQRLLLQQEMNEVIDSINEFNFNPEWKIDNNLKLEVTTEDIQEYKLNALHRRFEDISYDIKPLRSEISENYNDLYNLLEKVNWLVHRMERHPSTDNRKWILTVIRNETCLSDVENILPLDENDYENFDITGQFGKLYLDYCTVGKDLVNCWGSNDVELIKAGEVKQQTHAKPAINFSFHNAGIPMILKRGKMVENTDFTTYEGWVTRLHAWCEENNVGDYIDYKHPMYTYGRMVIGTCININTTDEYLEMIKETPYICGVRFE
jgi:hypothetical protein